MYNCIILLTIFLQLSLTTARTPMTLKDYMCLCSGEECYDVDPQQCNFGAQRNSCNRLVCKKGPGESCSHASILGECAAGMSCRCDVCTGCTRIKNTGLFLCGETPTDHACRETRLSL